MSAMSAKKIPVFFIIALMALSVFGFAYGARSGDGGGKGKSAGSAGIASGYQTPGNPKAQGGGGPGGEQDSQGQVQSDPQSENGGGAPASSQGKGPTQKAGSLTQAAGEGSGETTVGELVSSVEKVKRDQWKITKDQLKSLGYNGPVNEFVTAFNRQINAQKAEIREKILNGNANLTKAVVNETAERELARIRDEEIADLNITENDVISTLTVLMGDEGAGDEQLVSALQNEISFMDGHFKKSLYFIATNGTEGEKSNLADQLNNLLA